MPIDPSIALGFKQPDTMQSLSSLMNVANSAQTLQQNTQKTENEGITLQERKGLQGFFANKDNFTDETGALDLNKMQAGISKHAPTTGFKYMKEAAEAHQQSIASTRALNALTSENRAHLGSVLASIPPGTAPDVVHATVDALGKQFKGIEPLVEGFKKEYATALKQGPKAADDFVLRTARGVLPQDTQQGMNTPVIAGVNNNQQTYGVNVKPGVQGMPVGSIVPGTQTQIQLPPTTPTVGPNNQPGYLGPQPVAQPGMQGSFVGDPAQVAADIEKIPDPQERANARAAFAEQTGRRGAFIPSGAVPGANELKAGSIATVNQHWDNLNKQSESSQLLEGVLGNIKALAPGAITGTESDRKAYVTGLLNSLHLGNQATGDLQKDTDLLEKNIAQLGLNTPATTDAMRTIVGAARPHSTMSQGAIEEAAAQVTGQIQANRAVRNALVAPKQIASQTGDPAIYESVRTHLENIADPRAWQFQALPSKEAKAAMLAKLTPEDRAALRTKIEALHSMGLLK